MQFTLNLSCLQPGTYPFFFIILTAYLIIGVLAARLMYHHELFKSHSESDESDTIFACTCMGILLWPIMLAAFILTTILIGLEFIAKFLITTKNKKKKK